jgi:hypothetical protein
MCSEDTATYTRFRAQVEREDTLVNQRLSWLLTFEGFLFAAVAILANQDSEPIIKTFLFWAIPLTGLGAAISVIFAVFAAHQSVESFRRDWCALPPEIKDQKPSPFGGSHIHIPLLGPSFVIPIIVSMVWISWIFYYIYKMSPFLTGLL